MGAGLVGVLSLALASAPPAGTLRVAVMLSDDSPNYQAAHDAFLRTLDAAVPHLATTVHRLGSDAPSPDTAVTLALGTAAARRVATDGAGVAIFAVVGDPYGAGLVGPAGEPRLGVSGVSALPPPAEQLRLIRRATPDVRRVGVVINPDRAAALYEALERAHAEVGVELVPLVARRAEEVGPVLRQRRGDFDAVLALPDPTVWSALSLKAAVIFSLTERRPLFGFSKAFTRAGALASLSAERYEQMGVQAAQLALARLAGSPPRVEPPASVELSVNTVVAQRLGLTLPHGLTESAAEVYR